MNLFFSLVASLQLLKMTEAPLVSYENFMSHCAGMIYAKNMDLLRRFSLVPGVLPGQKPQDAASDDPNALEEFIGKFPKGSLAQEYLRFETALRHSAMKLRAAKLGAAFAAPNPVERERVLDTARWTKLDELEAKNVTRFNFDTLCAYSIRIQIAEKWAARNAGNSAEGLDRTVSSVRASDPALQS